MKKNLTGAMHLFNKILIVSVCILMSEQGYSSAIAEHDETQLPSGISRSDLSQKAPLASAMSDESELKVILSMDGGGMRGLIATIILDELEQRLGHVTGWVSFGAASSIMSVILLGETVAFNNGAPLYSAQDAIGIFERKGSIIFKDPSSLNDKVRLGLGVPKYSNQAGLIEVATPFLEGYALDQSKIPIIIPAYCNSGPYNKQVQQPSKDDSSVSTAQSWLGAALGGISGHFRKPNSQPGGSVTPPVHSTTSPQLSMSWGMLPSSELESPSQTARSLLFPNDGSASSSSLPPLKMERQISSSDDKHFHFNSLEAAANPLKNFKALEVALAACAAPTYYNAVEISSYDPARQEYNSAKTYTMVDGGMFENNPGFEAMTRAQMLFPGKDLLVISLGTGEFKTTGQPAKGNIGLQSLFDIALTGNEKTAQRYLKTFLPPKNGEPRYFRIQPKIASEAIPLDNHDPETLDLYREAAETWLKENSSIIDQLCEIIQRRVLKW